MAIEFINIKKTNKTIIPAAVLSTKPLSGVSDHK
jgi:hypothetical protein